MCKSRFHLILKPSFAPQYEVLHSRKYGITLQLSLWQTNQQPAYGFNKRDGDISSKL